MINFVDYNPQKILEEVLKSIEEALGVTLYPGDERRIFLQQLIPVLLAQKAEINFVGNQNLLSTSKEGGLDGIGEMFDVERLSAQFAKCTMEYSMPLPLAFDLLIPMGSRVTPDGKLLFATDENAIISAGQLSAKVTATADMRGTQHNELLPSQICNMVDVIPYITKVSNTDTSSGGTDVEDDEGYRERIRLSYQQHSTAGSEDAYVFWAKTAGNDIADIAVTTPSAGKVDVYVLPKAGAVATEELIARVGRMLSSDKHRPLTDQVTILTAEQVSYNIQLTYYIEKSNEAKLATIQQKVNEQVALFAEMASQKLGKNINPDILRGMLYECGVYAVDVQSPVFTALEKNQVAAIGETQLTYGGMK